MFMHFAKTLAATVLAISVSAGAVSAAEYNISVWGGGLSPTENFRVDAIQLAADIMMREAAVRGEDLKINIDARRMDEFQRAVTLAAEAKNLPNILVTGHDDLAPWADAGILRPFEKYAFLDTWPLTSIYPHLWDVGTYQGQVWGVPQDAESRMLFWNIPALKAIGWTDADVSALPEKVRTGAFTLTDMLDTVQKMQAAGAIEAGKGFGARPTEGWDYLQYYQSFGGKTYDATEGKVVLDTEAARKYYQFFVDAVKDGVIPATHIGSGWDGWNANVLGLKFGVWQGGSWQYAGWVSKGLDFFPNVQATLIPSGGEGGRANSITHPMVYLLTTQGSDEEAEIAAELITIASEPRINVLHAVKSSHLGISADEIKIPLYANDKWLSVASSFLPDANAVPNDTKINLYESVLFTGLQSAWTGTVSVDDAVKELVAKMKSELGDGVVIR